MSGDSLVATKALSTNASKELQADGPKVLRTHAAKLEVAAGVTAAPRPDRWTRRRSAALPSGSDKRSSLRAIAKTSRCWV
jgi:hypothetical protein